MAERLIWDKSGAGGAAGGGGAKSSASSTATGRADVRDRLMTFMAGDDVLLDRHLFEFDIRASGAHVDGLARIGVLRAGERDAILAALAQLLTEFRAGTFVLDENYEDGHSAIEARLIDRLGEAGRKVHAGRSRNDQVLTAIRLYVRDAMEKLAQLCRESARAFLDRAAGDNASAPMPGYTHLQRAVPSSVGLWMAAFAEAFIDDATLAILTQKWMDACPLGTAAGFGVNLPLDRDGVASALAFERVQINPMYAQNSRGKFEWQAMSALAQALLDLRRFAWDVSLYMTAEFGFVRLPDEYTTGSSIMPNKRNPDVVELLRASFADVAGALIEVQSVLSLPSGYHRDLQATKRPVIRAITNGLAALGILPGLVRDMQFDTERMRSAISPDMFATDRAVELVAEGLPFRDAYRRVAAEMELLKGRSPEESLNARVSPGASADLLLEVLRKRLVGLS